MAFQACKLHFQSFNVSTKACQWVVRDNTHKYAFTPPFKPNPWFELSLGYGRGGHMLLSQNVFAGATVDNWGQWHFVLILVNVYMC